MKTTFLGLLLLTATAISAQEQARTFQLADAPPLQRGNRIRI